MMQRPDTKLMTQVYLKSVVFLLLVSAGGKVAMVFGKASVLDMPSPLFGFVSNRVLLVLASLIEIAVVVLILRCRRREIVPVTAIAWMAMLFVSYRVALWVTGFGGYCDCLGVLPSLIDYSAKEADRIALGIVLYFIIGSGCILIRSLISRRKPPQSTADSLIFDSSEC